MGLLQKLKSRLGLGGSRRRREDRQSGEGGVRVEHEPEARTEAAVKGSENGWDDESVGEGAAESEDGDERSVSGDEDEVAGEAADETTMETEQTPGGGAGEGVPVDELTGIGSAYAERLGNVGVETVDDLAEADAAALDEETDIGQGRLGGWIEQASEY